ELLGEPVLLLWGGAAPALPDRGLRDAPEVEMRDDLRFDQGRGLRRVSRLERPVLADFRDDLFGDALHEHIGAHFLCTGRGNGQQPGKRECQVQGLAHRGSPSIREKGRTTDLPPAGCARTSVYSEGATKFQSLAQGLLPSFWVEPLLARSLF